MAQYQPSRDSVCQHPVPDWYHDAKLGIFVHWGPYSVPGWAPRTGEQKAVIANDGWSSWFARNPYAEWYLNSIRIEGSPSYRYHMDTYGAGYDYDNFTSQFREASATWDPEPWAELFQQAGARYVVLTTKHHDGFLLWPSDHPNPRKRGYQAGRDLVGELTRAVRARSMRMGLYYSGGLDWTFNQTPVQDLLDLLLTMPQSQEYADYVEAHWRELIERYEPDIVWNDIGYPAASDLNDLLAYYYNRLPEGVVNDRFMQADLTGSWMGRMLRRKAIKKMVARLLEWGTSRMESLPASGHYDFRTPEYTSFRRITPTKWEATRGLGYSFGFNRNERPEDLITVSELVHLLVDIVSKNGNLLLNVGPTADGTIPEMQRQRLVGLGQWLDVNGEAIFDTRPWRRAESVADGDIPVRFTQKDNALFAILLGRPAMSRVTIQDVPTAPGSTVGLLGRDGLLPWQEAEQGVVVDLPPGIAEAPAYVLRIGPEVRA